MIDALMVGNNLAVLVAAAELGAHGREVVLVTDGKSPGGHFRGLRLPEADFDIGMVLLESADGAETDPAGYRPGVRYDWTRFGGLVDHWQRGLVRSVRAPTPESLVEGRRFPDHLVADRLDGLTGADIRPPVPLPPDDPRHAAGKLTSAAYDTLTYREAAELNHGTDFQARLIDPFAEKLLGRAYDTLLARYHRAGWLPLYWPETVAAACAGRPTGLAEYPFRTTESGFVGDVVRALEQRLAGLPNVRVRDGAVTAFARDGDRWRVRTEDETWTHVQPVLGLGYERMQALLALPTYPRAPGASVALVCCLVRGAAVTAPVGCLSVVDPQFLTYRVTDQDALAGRDPAWHRVVVEAGPAAAERQRAGDDVTAELVGELSRLLGVTETTEDVRVLRTLAAPAAVPAPTADSLAAEAAARDALVAVCPQALLTGGLLGAGATSMNDQVVQGLAVAAQLR